MVVDPAVSEPIQQWLTARGLNLLAVLQTHHHSDHIGGTEGLLQAWPKAEVIAAKADLERIPFQTISVKDGDIIKLMDHQINVIEVPGHTKAHIAYFVNSNQGKGGTRALFCGDTLFSGGCGRLFEGSPVDMFLSLKKLNTLPEETQVFCAHEYTESNLYWARSINPKNNSIKKRLKEVIKLRGKGLLSLPTTISLERSINLFLMAKSPKELGELRNHKDNWKG